MMRAPRTAFAPGFSLPKYGTALVVERDRTDVLDGLARARQEHVEDRQGAADLPGMQIGLHLLGDEEAEAQDRAQRALDVVERSADRRRAAISSDPAPNPAAPARSARRSSPSNRTRRRRESPGLRTCRTWSAAAPPDWCPTRRGSSKAAAARAARTPYRRIWRDAARTDLWVSGISGKSADGIMPARNFAVSSAVAVRRADGKCRREQHRGSQRRNSQATAACSFATRRCGHGALTCPLAENGVNQKA